MATVKLLLPSTCTPRTHVKCNQRKESVALRCMEVSDMLRCNPFIKLAYSASSTVSVIAKKMQFSRMVAMTT